MFKLLQRLQDSGKKTVETTDQDFDTGLLVPSTLTESGKKNANTSNNKKKGKDAEQQPVSESSLVEIPTKKMKTSNSTSFSRDESSQSIQYSDEGSLPSSKPKLKSKKSKPSSSESSRSPTTPLKEKKGRVPSQSSLDHHLQQERTPKTKGGMSVVSDTTGGGESKGTKKTKHKPMTPAHTPETTPLGTKKKLVAAMHDSASTFMSTASEGNSSKRESMWKPIMHDDIFMSPKREAKMKALAGARGGSASSLPIGKQDDTTPSNNNKNKKNTKVKDGATESTKALSPKRQGSKTKAQKVPTSSKTTSSSTGTDSARGHKESLTATNPDSSIRLPEIPDLVSEQPASSSSSPTKNRRPRPNPMDRLSSSDTSAPTTTSSLIDSPSSRSSTIVTNTPVRQANDGFLKVQIVGSPGRTSLTKVSTTLKNNAAPRRAVSNSPPRREASKNQVPDPDTLPKDGVDSKKRPKSTERRPSSLKAIASSEEQELQPLPVKEPQRKLSKSKKKAANKDSDTVNPPRIVQAANKDTDIVNPPRILQTHNNNKTTTRSESVESGTPSEISTPPSSDREDKKALKEASKSPKESRHTAEEEEELPKESVDDKKVKKSTGKQTTGEDNQQSKMRDSQSQSEVEPQRKPSKSQKKGQNKETGEPSTPRPAPTKEKMLAKPEDLPSSLPLDSDQATIEETRSDHDDKKQSRNSTKAQREARRTAERSRSPIPEPSSGDRVDDKKGKKTKGKQTTKAKDDHNDEQELDSQARLEIEPQGKVSKSKKKSQPKDAGETKSVPTVDSNDEASSRPEIMASAGSETDAVTGTLEPTPTDGGDGSKKSRDIAKAQEKSSGAMDRAITPPPEVSQADSKEDKKEKKSKGKQAMSKAKDNETEQVLDSQSRQETQPQDKTSKSKKKAPMNDPVEPKSSPPRDDKETTPTPEFLASGSRTDSDIATLDDDKSPSNGDDEKESGNAMPALKEARRFVESTSTPLPEVSQAETTEDKKEKKSKVKPSSKAKDNDKEKIVDLQSPLETQPPEKVSKSQKQSQSHDADRGMTSVYLSQNTDMALRFDTQGKGHPIVTEGVVGKGTDSHSKNESRNALRQKEEEHPTLGSMTKKSTTSSQNDNVTVQPSNKAPAKTGKGNQMEADSKPQLATQEQGQDSKIHHKERTEALDKDNDGSELSPIAAARSKLRQISETMMVSGSQTDLGMSPASTNPSELNDENATKSQEVIASLPDASPSASMESSNRVEPVERRSVTIHEQDKVTKGEDRRSSERPWYARQGSNSGATGQPRLEQQGSNSSLSSSAPIYSRSNTPSPKPAEKSSILGTLRPQLARADTTIVRSNTPSPRPGGKPSVASRQRQSFAGYGTPRTSPKPNGTEGPGASPRTPLHSEEKDRFDIVAMTPPFRDSTTTNDLMPFITPKRPSSIRNDSQFASSKNALIEALTTPVRKQREVLASIDRTPRTLKRGYVEMNQKSTRNPDAKTPGLRVMDSSHHGKDKARTYIDAALDMLDDDEKVDEVENLVRKIESLGGFPKTRRLSLRDNELVGQLVMAVRNDPRVTAVHVDAAMFGTISSTLLTQFIDSLRINLHVKTLSFQGLELGNDFLYDLVATMEYNFVVEDIDLSKNCFTSEGLATFCQALALTNESVKRVNLKNQTTPVSEASQVDVLEALEQNKTLTTIELDFVSDDGPEKLEKIMERNRVTGPQQPLNAGEKLINVLTFEAEKAQEVWDQQQAELHLLDDDEYDWDYFYELALLFDKHKLKKEVEENAMDFSGPPKRKNADDLSAEEKKKFLFGEFRKNMEESVMAFNEDGSFLTPEFIAKYFKERPEEGALDFDFHGQWKLFRRFPIHDPARQTIVDKFIEAIVSHPRANDLTGINMANTGAGDDFLIALSKRCLADPSLLPNLHTVNFETNFINEPGVVALANLVASPTSCKYMQVIRLENQKGLLKSKAEFALAKAMRVNRSIVVISLTVRNLLERERIGKYIMRNVDLIRQARQEYMKARGLQRKRNKVERVFDSVKENNEDLVKIDMKGNERFLTLTKEEKIKSAQAFSHNTHVKELLLDGCGIDDVFAQALGEAIVTNTALQKVSMEGNDISGEGIKALFKGLGKNQSIKELRLHKQSKLLATSDEELLPDFLEENTTITKIGMDLRSKMAQIKLDQRTRQNISLELKEKAAAKGEESVEVESVYMLRF